MLYLLKTQCTTQLLTTTCSTRVAGQIVEAASNKGWLENEEDDQVRYYTAAPQQTLLFS